MNPRANTNVNGLPTVEEQIAHVANVLQNLSDDQVYAYAAILHAQFTEMSAAIEEKERTMAALHDQVNELKEVVNQNQASELKPQEGKSTAAGVFGQYSPQLQRVHETMRVLREDKVLREQHARFMRTPTSNELSGRSAGSSSDVSGRKQRRP